jgi:tripartite-type tricarboxylate transporter receptor subunit TctC
MARSLTRRNVVVALGASAIGTPLVSLAQAGYPNKPVKIVVSFSPGGTTDILARFLAAKLGDAMGQPFVVENKPGAGGILGNDFVVKAPADGYTFLMGSASNLVVAPGMYKNMPYDAKKDLIPVALAAAGPFVIVVNPQVPAKTFPELLALARAEPGKITFATSGNGTSLHLAGELINTMANVKMTHVPYKGTGPAMLDTISGQVNVTLSDMVPFVPHIQAGKLRPLAQTTAQRSKLLPDLPTVAETLPGYDATSWYGLMATAGTPAAVVQRVNQELGKILQQADVRSRYAQLGVDAVLMTPNEFGVYINREMAKWADVIARSGAKVE